MGQSPGSRFLCLGPRTHTVRTKGASLCFKAPAARPPHRYISATATLDLLLLSFLLKHGRTDRSNTVGLGQFPRLPSHALYVGSSSQLRVGNGQLGRPSRAGEGEARLEAYCAGVTLSAALRLVRTGRSCAHAPSCPNTWKDRRLSCLQVSAG